VSVCAGACVRVCVRVRVCGCVCVCAGVGMRGCTVGVKVCASFLFIARESIKIIPKFIVYLSLRVSVVPVVRSACELIKEMCRRVKTFFKSCRAASQ